MKLVQEFRSTELEKRTVEGLSKCIDVPQYKINLILHMNPDIFIPVKGCKGDMWKLAEDIL